MAHAAHRVSGVLEVGGQQVLLDDELEHTVQIHGVLKAVHHVAELGQALAGVGEAGGQEPVDGGGVSRVGDAVVGGGADGAVAAHVHGALSVHGVNRGGVIAVGHVGGIGGQIQRGAVRQSQGGGAACVLVVDHINSGGVSAVTGGQVVGHIAGLGHAGHGEGAVGDLGGDALGGLGHRLVEIDLDRAVKSGGSKGDLALAALGVDAVAVGGDGAVFKNILLQGQHSGQVNGGAALPAATAGAAGTSAAGALTGRGQSGHAHGRHEQRCAQDRSQHSFQAFSHVQISSFCASLHEAVRICASPV